MKFVKKPIAIDAERIMTPFVVNTLEGQMRGNPGDWLVTGVRGEQYPIKHEILLETYDPGDDDARRALEELTEVEEEECVCIPFPAK
jgi:hypothetical protein